MYGCVSAWSAQMPRPQKRQVPTAVFLQCQQSMKDWPLLVRLVLPHGVGSDHRIERPFLERLPNESVEAFSLQSKEPHRRRSNHGGRPGHVQQQGDLAEVRSGPHLPLEFTALDDVDPTGTDRVEGISFRSLLDDVFARGNVHPPSALEKPHQLVWFQMREARQIPELHRLLYGGCE